MPKPMVVGHPGTSSRQEPERALSYVRVSTGRQAETDLSIPDQKRQIAAWAAARGMVLVGEYVEAGASATDDKRAAFQALIDAACDPTNGITAIIVHSYSRFFRDAFGLEFYLRKLSKHGVRLISITQELGDDPAQAMMRQVIALFDEYQSRENAKHVLRAMSENARQGYWNGSRAPFGYRAVECERKGARVKKRLDIEPSEAEIVQLIFKLILEGQQGSGPMGVKAVVCWLNEHGYRTRSGARWGVEPLHAMLSNPVYSGRMRFNQTEARSGRRKTAAEQIFASVPAIIDLGMFQSVQDHLKSRNPKVTPPRVVTGPILLTGLATCGDCNGAMTLRTGTSKGGRVYRYYSCSTCARQGKTACPGRSIQMDKLDHLVTNQLLDRLLEPSRLAELLETLSRRRAVHAADEDRRITAMLQQADEAEAKLNRLYALVEDGDADPDEGLKARIASLRADRDSARAAASRIQKAKGSSVAADPERITAFGRLMRERLTTGDIAFRKAYLGAIIDKVEVHAGLIRLRGRKDVLEAEVLGRQAISGVRGSVRRWRTQEDSNL